LRFLQLTMLHRQPVPLLVRSGELKLQPRHLLCKSNALSLGRVEDGSCLKP
jgi:hypothetical protein